jgi:outer membrane protein OmpA-like peptidoglycan-associated protein
MVLKMKNPKTRFLILCLLFSISSLSFAQRSDLLYAEAQFEHNNFRKAAVEFEKVFLDKPSYEISKKTAVSWDNIYEFNTSKLWWDKVVSFEDATREDYLKLLLASRRSDPEFSAASLLAESPYSVADFPELSQSVSISNVAYRAYSLESLEELNSSESDYGLYVLSSGKRLFASNRGEVKEAGKKLMRLDAASNPIKDDTYHSDDKNYYGLYSQVEGEEPVKIDVLGFDLHHLSDPMLVPGTETIFFTATPNRVKRKDPVIYPGIFRGTFVESENRIVDIVPFPINQTNQYGTMNPMVHPESKRLYFSSSAKSGLGGYDIFYVTYDQDWNFGQPVNAGLMVNTTGNERDPFIKDDYLYFASDGQAGFGGLDIFKVKLDGMSPVGAPENLGDPVNTISDDFGFQLAGERLAYLSSDRLSGIGYDDFYKLEWKERKIKIEVKANDAGNESLLAKMKIELNEGDSMRVVSLEELAGILGKTDKAKIRVSHPGYFRSTQELIIDENNEKATIQLTAIPYELDVFQSVIYYDLDKDILRPLSKEKLDEVEGLLKKHSSLLTLRIESHTDVRASYEYNEKLSERRANSATKYLKNKGIETDRISSFWFSKSKLAVNCGDGVPCSESDHQLNRRSELTLHAFSDRNIDYDLPEGSTAADFETSEAAIKWFIKN